MVLIRVGSRRISSGFLLAVRSYTSLFRTGAHSGLGVIGTVIFVQIGTLLPVGGPASLLLSFVFCSLSC
jgi:hypothetical protein